MCLLFLVTLGSYSELSSGDSGEEGEEEGGLRARPRYPGVGRDPPCWDERVGERDLTRVRVY